MSSDSKQDDTDNYSQKKSDKSISLQDNQKNNGDEPSKKDGRESKDDKDIEFYFFYDIVKKSLLKRKEVGGKKSFSNII